MKDPMELEDIHGALTQQERKMSDYIECPYCGEETEICHDDGHGYEEDVAHRETCCECDKEFIFFTTIVYHYEPNKADCLNGGEHDFKPTTTYPKRFTEMECTQCWERRKPSIDEIREIMSRESDE